MWLGFLVFFYFRRIGNSQLEGRGGHYRQNRRSSLGGDHITFHIISGEGHLHSGRLPLLSVRGRPEFKEESEESRKKEVKKKKPACALPFLSIIFHFFVSVS